ncbi:MAG: DUF1653 domain-containing protein [Lachnospiraceae bacterium]|nr:DUF1653 domain-containing protein [Lachnospiraceae bacterium]
MRHNPQPQEIYRHFKGNLYQIRCLAKHSETGEMMVVYQAMYGDFQIYVRPLAMFMEEVDRGKYPDAVQHYRFECLNAPEEKQEVMHTATVQTGESVPEQKNMQFKTQEEVNIDPLVLEFLDADSYERRLEILSMLHCRIDDEMINTMAVAVDIEIKEGDIEDRYEELKNCLLTFEKYECNRLR